MIGFLKLPSKSILKSFVMCQRSLPFKNYHVDNISKMQHINIKNENYKLFKLWLIHSCQKYQKQRTYVLASRSASMYSLVSN